MLRYYKSRGGLDSGGGGGGGNFWRICVVVGGLV
jgi:hypothetical protein